MRPERTTWPRASRPLASAALVALAATAPACEEEVVHGRAARPRPDAAADATPSATPSGSAAADAALAPGSASSTVAPRAAPAPAAGPSGTAVGSAAPSPSPGAAATAPAPGSVAAPGVPAAPSPAIGGGAAPRASVTSLPSEAPPPLAFADFSGPAVKPPVALGQRAWAVVPVSGGWEAVKFAIVPVVGVEATAAVVEQDARRFLVPGAFLAPTSPAPALAAGDPVLVATSGTRVFGRVLATRPGKVDVRFKFAGLLEEREVAADEVIEIEGRPFLGAPVAIREREVTRFGQLVHQSPGKTWVVQIGGRARSLPPGDVEVLPAPPKLAVGDEVLALRIDKLVPATISAVLDDRLQYEVRWAGGEETSIATYEAVTRRR